MSYIENQKDKNRDFDKLKLKYGIYGKEKNKNKPIVFISHGNNKLWIELERYLEKNLHVKTLSFESEIHTGETNKDVIEKMMQVADFAFIILTSEDKTANNGVRARQNVVHELGLFQAKLGLEKTIVIVQKGIEEFTNIDGIQKIYFKNNDMESIFVKVRNVLIKNEIIQN